MLKLNLGCGDFRMDGYENIDIKTGQSAYPLAFDPGTVDEIRASHLLEHFPYEQAGAVLQDWHRALKPGGTIKIAVPDLEKIATAYLNGVQAPIQGMIMGGHIDEYDYHKTIYDRESLTEALRAVGFRDIRVWRSDFQDSSSIPFSLNLAGTKPGPLPMKVAAIMSVPRLGFMDNFSTVTTQMGAACIPYRMHQGVFWSQCLTRGIEETIKDGFDAVITLDYDTVFARDDALALVRLLHDTPDATAIIAMQQSRFRNTPLMTMKDAAGKVRSTCTRDELAADLVPIFTGHFGLSIFRAADMERVPKPWFHGKPDAEGRWGEGRIDDDVSFWHQLDAAGLKAYLAPRVVVGHMELMVRWPDHNCESQFQMISDYRDAGKPDGVWQ